VPEGGKGARGIRQGGRGLGGEGGHTADND
jgi:hypothetical protein